MPVVKDYLARLNVSLLKRPLTNLPTQYFDFKTGNVGSSNVAANLSTGLATYAAQLAKYPYVERGFDLPYPIPSDLLMPWGLFIKKYHLEAMAGFHHRFAQGMGNTLAQPTLYVMKNFGSDILRSLQVGFLTTELHDNSLLYKHATEALKGNILLNSNIIVVDRSGSRVRIITSSKAGLALATCQKLIVAIPPKLENLVGWDLSTAESKSFSQFINTGYYTGLLRNTGLPDNISIVNVSPKTEYNEMVLPGIYNLISTDIPGVMGVLFGSAHALPDNTVKKQILSDVRRLKYPGKSSSDPEFVVYARHAPFELTVSSTAIAGGFYKALSDLQGQRHTWYTGAAFHTQDSSLLWEFTEALLPNITGSCTQNDTSGGRMRRGSFEGYASNDAIQYRSS